MKNNELAFYAAHFIAVFNASLFPSYMTFSDYGITASLSYDDDPLAAMYNFFSLDAGTKTTVNAKIEEVPIFFSS